MVLLALSKTRDTVDLAGHSGKTYDKNIEPSPEIFSDFSM